MFHHNILSRNEDETIKKIYRKQKEGYVKGDWYQLLEGDFSFKGVEMKEDYISRVPKDQ